MSHEVRERIAGAARMVIKVGSSSLTRPGGGLDVDRIDALVGEIAARPPGAHIVLANSYAHDVDMYRAWARAVVDDAFDGPWPRKYAVGVAFLRGIGRGRVSAIRGVDAANAKVGKLVVESRLPAIGTPRADSYEGEGYVIVRDPDTEVVKAAVKTVIETIQLSYA